MKRLLKYFLYLVFFVAGLALGTFVYLKVSAAITSRKNMALLAKETKMLLVEGMYVRDLNKNEKLDPYEDPRQPLNTRVEDILSQMTVEEKAGMMFHQMIAVHPEGELMEGPILDDMMSYTLANSTLIVAKKINCFNLFYIPEIEKVARWHNNIQRLAERTRLGIPVTVSTDPRHHIDPGMNVAMFPDKHSVWPQPLGLAATRDTALVFQFAGIARQQYLAAGIRVALHPMADLATEPRWPRINGTFGEDARLVSSMVYAYIKGFQGDTLGPSSVACVTKHFSGGGPQKEGLDPHFTFQKGQVYPGNNFKYHLIPFHAAFAAGTSQIMPYYGVPMNQSSENVGFSFNKEMITGLLRQHYKFDGIVCTDWGLISDVEVLGYEITKARAHGVEHLSREERIIKIIDAGVDQFGGEDFAEELSAMIKAGKISEERIDQSVRRLLREKFRLGLFDNPFIEEEKCKAVWGNRDFIEAGRVAQRKSIVLLKNRKNANGLTLPLTGKPKIYIENLDREIASQYGVVVDRPEKADFAIVRITTPFDPMHGFVEKMFHHGSLDFKDPEKARLLKLMETVPTIVDVFLDRPAVMPEFAANCAGLLGNFGAQDDAVLDIIFGKFYPTAKLPIELPSSMDAVRNQKEDLPYDSKDPLFPFGYGLTY